VKQEGPLPPTGRASAALCYAGDRLIAIVLYLYFGWQIWHQIWTHWPRFPMNVLKF